MSDDTSIGRSIGACPASPHCPYCDADGEHEREAEAADFEALIEAHERPQNDEDRDELLKTWSTRSKQTEPVGDELVDLITGRPIDAWAADYLEQREIDRVVKRVTEAFRRELSEGLASLKGNQHVG